MLKQLKKSPTGMFGLIVIILFVLMAIFAPLLAPFNPAKQALADRLAPGFWAGGTKHLLGADAVGRDVLSRIIYGSRISLGVAFAGSFFGCIAGVVLGSVAGYYGKWVDTLIGRIIDIQLTFPFILLSILIVAILGSGIRNIILVAALTSWVRFARVVRGEVLSIKEMGYIEAVNSLGGSNFRIIFGHIVPNVLSPIIVIATLEMAKIITMEASLSYLGLGVPPSVPTWGRMLSEATSYLQTNPSLAIVPGVAITLLVLSVNLFGDWLRDYFDPKLGNN